MHLGVKRLATKQTPLVFTVEFDDTHREVACQAITVFDYRPRLAEQICQSINKAIMTDESIRGGPAGMGGALVEWLVRNLRQSTTETPAYASLGDALMDMCQMSCIEGSTSKIGEGATTKAFAPAWLVHSLNTWVRAGWGDMTQDAWLRECLEVRAPLAASAPLAPLAPLAASAPLAPLADPEYSNVGAIEWPKIGTGPSLIGKRARDDTSRMFGTKRPRDGE
jgi:hypothetical protein